MVTDPSDSNGDMPVIHCVSPSLRGLVILIAALQGCAAFHPIEGVPASNLPYHYRAPYRDTQRTINPMLLTRSRPAEYLVDSGDVLAIYIPGVLGTISPEFATIGEAPPINQPRDPEMPPTVGYPVTVRDDGTISLPQAGPIPVRGLTLRQVEETLRDTYTRKNQVLAEGKDRILVSLQRPREYRVLVVRQEANSATLMTSSPGSINLGATRRGVARIVQLKAYENDVLHALSRVQGADGLPGLDAENAIYVIRRRGGEGGRFCPPGHPGRPHPAAPGGHWSQEPQPTPAVPMAPMPEGAVPPETGRLNQPRTVLPAGHQPVVRFQSPEASESSPWPQRTNGGIATATTSPVALGSPSFLAPTGHAGTPSAVRRVDWESSEFADWEPMTQPSNPPALPATTHAAPLMIPGASETSVAPMPEAAMGGASLQPLPAHDYPMGPGVPHGMDFGQFSSVPMGSDTFVDPGLMQNFSVTIDGPGVIKIPVRLNPGEMPQFTEEDVTLYDGDIVFIESRDSEVFYTGGLLGGGEYTLPRDRDLRALEALSIAQSNNPQGTSRSIGGVSALNQDVTISASQLIVLRTLPNGTKLPIQVDLNRLKKDMTSCENIVIQPGDFLILQYTRCEAVAAFIERHLLEGALFTLAASQFPGSN